MTTPTTSIQVPPSIIKIVPPEVPYFDIMGGAARYEVNVDGQHGTVALIDLMPRMCPQGSLADYAIVQAARVSYGVGTKKVSEDEGLIRYLTRHMHTTPLEMVEFKFHCRMPIFVARQWIRHRTANVNEISARYSELPGEFWVPVADGVRAASNKNKQVSEGEVDVKTSQEFIEHLEDAHAASYDWYQQALKKGIGRELARIILPLSIYTEWYWKIDLHNLFHFLGLRMHEHAQEEIRVYANAMYNLIAPFVPVASKAFLQYHRHMGGLLLTELELDALRAKAQGIVPSIDSTNKREREEAYVKFQRMGMQFSKRNGD